MKKVFGFLIILLSLLSLISQSLNLSNLYKDFLLLIDNTSNSYGIGHFLGALTYFAARSTITILLFVWGLKWVRKQPNPTKINPETLQN